MTPLRFLPALIVAAAVAGIWALQGGRITVPPHWNPWAPLNLAEPPNWLTGYKLQRTAAEPAWCIAALATVLLLRRRA